MIDLQSSFKTQIQALYAVVECITDKAERICIRRNDFRERKLCLCVPAPKIAALALYVPFLSFT